MKLKAIPCALLIGTLVFIIGYFSSKVLISLPHTLLSNLRFCFRLIRTQTENCWRFLFTQAIRLRMLRIYTDSDSGTTI